MSDYIANPKLADSNLVACFPQGKPCPVGCNQCFAHHPGCYAPMDRPNVPDPAWVGSRIVRMNDIGDSNVDRPLVIRTAARYPNVYFNTSIPRLEFPDPVVLTVNPKEEQPNTWTWPEHCINNMSDLMAVRVRLTPANVKAAADLVMDWADTCVAVLVSHMRYYDLVSLADMLGLPANKTAKAADYEHRTHVLNTCWQPSAGLQARLGSMIGLGRRHGAYLCGDMPCKDCRQCESLYWLARRRMELSGEAHKENP
jgi:hypothetical protein